jgi:DNA polymerase (family 10)
VDRYLAALVLDEIASLLALQDAERFRVRAYRRAARAIERFDGDLSRGLETGALAAEPDIGPATLRVVRELVSSGHSRLHDRLRAETPAGLVRLRSVPGLGPRRVRTLHEQLGIETLSGLREAAEAGRLRALPGFGPAIEGQVLDGIGFVDSAVGRRRQPEAYATAHRLIGYLAGLDVVAVHLAGEARRRCETVGAIDLLAVAEAPGVILEAFVDLPALILPERTDTDRARARLADGTDIRLRCVKRESAAAAWVVDTGGDDHLAALRERAAERGLRLDARGLWRGEDRCVIDDEEGLYAALELAWVPPELREGRGEVDAAAADRLPALVAYEDLRGTFHCHTTWSDGLATVAELGQAAVARGWRYLGIADHSVSAAYAGGLTVDEVRRQHEEIDRWNASRGGELRLFKGVEADILADGSLDYDDHVLASFDYVVGSVHSRTRMAEEAMTRRIARAVANRRLTILGHPTGRLLLARDAYEVDLDAIINAAAGSGAAIEINADPHRLDMDWRYWPAARAKGVPCAIDPDAHSVTGLGAVTFGVAMARKGWLEPRDVVNTWEMERVESFFGGA